MPSITEKHRQAKLSHPTPADRLSVLEEAVAAATGRSVSDLRAEAQQRADDRSAAAVERRR